MPLRLLFSYRAVKIRLLTQSLILATGLTLFGASIAAATQDVIPAPIIFFLMTILFIFGLYALLQRAVFKPLRTISQTLEEIGQKDHTLHEMVLHDHEIGNVAITLKKLFAAMADNDRQRMANEARVLAYAQQLEGKNIEIEMARTTAERATTLKSEFLANMSHEIRTPINGVIGMTNLLLETTLNDKQKHYAETALGSAEFLLALINDILDFSKIESGKMHLEAIPFDLPQLIQGILDRLIPKASAKNVELLTHAMVEPPRFLVGDPVRISQIITNLLDNAIKFTNQGYVKLILDAAPTGDNLIDLKLAIKDTGIGIPLEAQASIFDKFTQADASTTRKFGGTGLGLAICKQLAGMMGGQIGVESAPGAGSTFWCSLLLPIAEELPETQPSTPPMDVAQLSLAHRHILLVEDNEVNSYFTRELLTRLECRVTSVVNGREAVDAFHNQPDFDLVLMDCQMPEMDGFAATRSLRQMERDGRIKHIPIVALTALAMKGDRERCLDAGMDDYITKPLRKDVLYSTLQRWLNGVSSPQDKSYGSKQENIVHSDSHYLDEAIILDVRDFMGDKFFSVVQMYLRDTENYLGLIKAAATGQGDIVNAQRAAHSLRSSSAHLGIRRLAEKAGELETLIIQHLTNGTPLDLQSWHAELTNIFAQTQIHIEQALAA